LESVEANVNLFSRNSIDVVAVQGHVDVLNVQVFAKQLDEIAGLSNNLVVDLREASYIDSAALEQIAIALQKQNDAEKGFGLLIAEGSQPDEVLHVVMMHTLTKVTSDPVSVGLKE
jgi:anti-anti-sigma regulatory factor